MYRATALHADGNITLLQARSRKGVLRKLGKLQRVIQWTVFHVRTVSKG